MARVDDGRVTLVGKKTMPPEEATGEFIGLARFSARARRARCASASTSGARELAGKPYGRAPRFEVAYLTDLLNDLIDSRRGDAAGVHRRRLARDRHRRGSRARQGGGELVRSDPRHRRVLRRPHLEALARARPHRRVHADARRRRAGRRRSTDVTILVARSKEVKAQAIARAKALALIVRAGAGVNTIDVKAASRPRRLRRQLPGQERDRRRRADHGRCCSRSIAASPTRCADLRAGTWNKKEYGKADGLFGRTLGVVGIGSIGQEVIRRARAFGMHVVAWSRSLDDARAAELGVERMRTVPELCGRADVVTLHVALTPETRGLIGEAALGAHAAERHPDQHLARRGGRRARRCARAIAEKQLRVALDVFDDEPKGGSGAFADALGQAARRLRHAPRRRVDRAGAGGDRRRDGAHRARLRRARRGAQLRQPGDALAGGVPARGAPLRQGGRARRGARRHPPPRHQRRGDGEHHLRGRAGGERQDPPVGRGRRPSCSTSCAARPPRSSTSTWWSWSRRGPRLPRRKALLRSGRGRRRDPDRPSSPAWVDAACADLATLLVDHAHCEKSAASTAVRFLFRYPDWPALVAAMSRLAREELVHFERVLKELEARGVTFRGLPSANYAAALFALVRCGGRASAQGRRDALLRAHRGAQPRALRPAARRADRRRGGWRASTASWPRPRRATASSTSSSRPRRRAATRRRRSLTRRSWPRPKARSSRAPASRCACTPVGDKGPVSDRGRWCSARSRPPWSRPRGWRSS